MKQIKLLYTSVILSMLALTGCDMIYNDLDPCPQGVALRFKLDYNIEFADAFSNQVECLTVHIYDADSNFVATKTETSSLLDYPGYTMTFDLPAGKYHAVAYGGTECEESSFAHPDKPAAGSVLSNLSLKMHDDHNQRHLHDQYWGCTDFTVTDDALDYTYDTVPMQRNTNHFRLVFANINHRPLDGKDFEFKIEADNTHFNHDNSLRNAGVTTYKEWTSGQYNAGVLARGAMPVETRADSTDNTYRVAYGELSTSRIMQKQQSAGTQSPMLIVRHKPTGKEVMNVPLVRMMLMSKSDEEGYRIKNNNGKPMSDQEYLDRQGRWNMMFFLNDELDLENLIYINSWRIVLQDADL